jgi:hypothetical protein
MSQPVEEGVKRPIQLICACCGEPAPALKQWWNRDTGYGCCTRCFEEIRAEHGEAYAVECYGRPGTHHSI